MTSLVFGLSVTVFIYMSQHSQAGHLNPVVSICLAVAGYIQPTQAIVNSAAQLLGSVTASGLLKMSLPDMAEMDLGANAVQDGFDIGNAFVAEMVATFALLLVMFETMLHPSNRVGKMGPLAVGFVVFLVHGVVAPIDNCSLNPARSFGPAIVTNTWDGFWVFVLGPVVGGLLAIPAHIAFLSDWGRTVKRRNVKGRNAGTQSDGSV